MSGHAVEARLYAEDPAADFRPSTGRLVTLSLPEGPGIRIDSGVEEGSVVGPHYDAMLAKVIASGADRAETVARLQSALERVRVAGPKTNLAFLSAVVASPEFRAGSIDTGFVDRSLPRLCGDALTQALAAAAVAAFASREAARASDGARGPWARGDAFELGGIRRRSSLSVEIDGEPAAAHLAWSPDGPTVIAIGGAKPEYSPAAEIVWGAGEALVIEGGRQLRVAFPDPLSRDLDAAAGSGEVAAPISGRVTEVAVEEGTLVARGDPLFSVEAMKMEHGVTAPCAGVVAAVRVTPGQQIAEGAIAVVIEAEE
jgi:3-methylcrotonyl-CoA carboxylase alpha subunit